jgi:hypothetical protein
MGNLISNNIKNNNNNNTKNINRINENAFVFEKTSTINNNYIYKIEVDNVNKNNIETIKQKLENLNCKSIDNNLNEIIKSLQFLVDKENAGIISQTDSFLFKYYNLPMLEIKNNYSKEYRKNNNITQDDYKCNFISKLHEMYVKY